jgi:glutamate racemase
LGALRERYPDLPVVGVIEPGAEAAVAASASQRIAVIATEGTIRGGAYQAAIRRRSPNAEVTARACSMFVALAEEGWTSGAIVEAAAHRYLDPVFSVSTPPDTLVLGCTHFPVLEPALRAVLPPQVRIVDSAATTAAALLAELRGAGADPRGGAPGTAAGAAVSAEAGLSGTAPGGRITWLATDDADRFARVGARFFGEGLGSEAVQIIDL